MSDLLRCDNCGKTTIGDYAYEWWHANRNPAHGRDRYASPRGDLCSDACMVEFVTSGKYTQTPALG